MGAFMPKCHWFFYLMRLRVVLAALIPGRRGRRNQRGIDRRAFLQQQACFAQVGGDRAQKLFGQALLFEPVAKAQDADTIRLAALADQAGKLAVQAHIE